MKAQMSNTVLVTIEDRGDGSGENPVRSVVKYWSVDGTFLAERDCCAPRYDSVKGSWIIHPLARVN